MARPRRGCGLGAAQASAGARICPSHRPSHPSHATPARPDFDLALDLGFLTKNRAYTFFKPKFIIYVRRPAPGTRAPAALLTLRPSQATYLSEKIGYWRYISIYRHLQRNPDCQLYPLFEYFENWWVVCVVGEGKPALSSTAACTEHNTSESGTHTTSHPSMCIAHQSMCIPSHSHPPLPPPLRCQDENRHGDFLAACLKARPELLLGTEAQLWCRFFCLSVYVTMYLNDHTRSAFYEALGMETRKFNQHVIIETNKSSERLFPNVPDVENPEFWVK